MAQFDVFPNPSVQSRDKIPYLVVLQSDLLDDFDNAIVAPLRIKAQDKAIPVLRLNPTVDINGQSHFLRTQELAAIPVRSLKGCVANLSSQRDEILAALDILFTGF
jgi:toxin CcdB